MLHRLISFASGVKVLVALAAMVIGGFLLFHQGPYPALKEQTGNIVFPEEQASSPAEVIAFLEQLGTAGRQAYAQAQMFDLANPALMGVFFVLLLAWLAKRSRLGGWIRLIILTPVVFVVGELLENHLLYQAALAYPEIPSGLGILGLATQLKFVGLMIAALTAVGLTGLVYYRRRAVKPDA